MKEKPEFKDAYFYTAYNNLTRNWSFYYISPLSGQYYEGKKDNNNWYFYRSFDFGNGNKFIRRQFWVLTNANTLERHTENLHDEGKSWKRFSISVLERVVG